MIMIMIMGIILSGIYGNKKIIFFKKSSKGNKWRKYGNSNKNSK
jgi:hypothetical protein